MKSRSEIWLRALDELGAQCSVSTHRDVVTFAARVEREGDAFFTLTLPQFGKDFERVLADGSIPSDTFMGFARLKHIVYTCDSSGNSAKQKVKHGIPKFLSGFLELIFDTSISVGVSSSQSELAGLNLVPFLRDFPNKEAEERAAKAVQAVRQLCLMFAKEKELCSDSVTDAAIAAYVATDRMLDEPLLDERADTLFEGGRLDRTRKVIRLAFGDALSVVDRKIFDGELIPGHGPGATADRLRGNQKWTFPTWHDRLEFLFPYGDYALPNHRFVWKYQGVKHLAPGDEPPVRITAVPKTQKAPRLIAIEPTCMQYVQQGISRELVRQLEGLSSSRSFVGFTDQTINNAMAWHGSTDGSLATLDLSEASDRVANWVVDDLFSDFPWFSEGIDACRSTHAQLPSGEVIQLLKFASMGSAMTFPIEAIVFSAIVLERVLAASGQPISRQSIKALRGKVRVYGDDIIVPNNTAETVTLGLETFGFKVNRGKSFWTGKFRESCGKEFWNGYDVSIVRVRTRFPASRHDAAEVISTVSTRNQFYKAGMRRTAALYDSGLEVILQGHYPIVSEGSSVLGRLDDSISYDINGFDSSTQTPLVKGWMGHSKVPVNGIDGEDALMKCLAETIGAQNVDSEHLLRSGRPRAVSIKLVKARPY